MEEEGEAKREQNNVRAEQAFLEHFPAAPAA